MIFAKIVFGYGNAQNRSHKFFFFRSALEYGDGRARTFSGMIPIGEPFRSESEAIHLRGLPSAVWKAVGRDEETRWLQSDKRLFVACYPLVLCRMNINKKGAERLHSYPAPEVHAAKV